MRRFFYFALSVILLVACTPKQNPNPFIEVNADGQFIRNGKPYYFVGTNFWYGAILGSEGQGGNRERLHQELDFLKSIGIDNLRVWWVEMVKTAYPHAYNHRCKQPPVFTTIPSSTGWTIL